MAMSIRTNVASLNAQRNIFQTQYSLESSLSKLSSGYRITKAGDDAAGLGISVNLEAQIRSYNQAARNAQDGISVVQTGEGALNEVSNILTRMRELAMESASDGIGDTERAYIQEETSALGDEIQRIANATEFNGTMLLNSTTSLTFQVGIRNVGANDRIDVTTVDVRTTTLGIDAMSLSSAASARTALDTIDAALRLVSGARAVFGAQGNRLTNVVNQIHVAAENISAANSRIRDVDVAEESSKLTRSQILMQAGVSVLAQANQAPQVALKLIGA
ncbi:MAG: flagellin FliC [Deltaproteobacteria bacterium]|nr:flagellin FliC [Deltaproteobacteria bacterium]